MPSPYRVENLIHQNTESLVQHVVTEEGAEFVRTRLQLSPESLAGLFGEGVFTESLGKLRSLKHGSLREVMDGGMDEEDGCPWVTSAWIAGKTLSVQELQEKDIRSLGKQCQRLVEELGEVSKVVNFSPKDILLKRTVDGELHALFSVDYFRWFRDMAAGQVPGAGRSVVDEVRKLREGLVIKQLKLPRKPSQRQEVSPPPLAAYEAPRTGWMMPVLGWLGLFLILGVISWLTVVGMKRMEENPRKEMIFPKR